MLTSLKLNKLATSMVIGKIYMQNELHINYNHHPIMETIYTDYVNGSEVLIRNRENQKSYSGLFDQLSLKWRAYKDIMTIGGYLEYAHCHSKGNDYSHYLNTTSWHLQFDFMLGKWNMGMVWNSATKQLWGETIMKNSPMNTFYANHSFGNIRIGLIGQYMFQKNGSSEFEQTKSEKLNTLRVYRSSSLNNLVAITFAWNMRTGKIHHSSENTFDNKDNDSGVSK